MDYIQSEIRRQDRLLDEKQARELLRNGEFGVLSMSDEKGNPYGIPISYVWDGNDIIYLHAAPDGRKIAMLKANGQVSFCVTGMTNVHPEKFTTEYSSIILDCTTNILNNDDERMNALMLLVSKYSPGLEVTGERYAKGSFHRTAVIALKIKSWSGKSKVIGLKVD